MRRTAVELMLTVMFPRILCFLAIVALLAGCASNARFSVTPVRKDDTRASVASGKKTAVPVDAAGASVTGEKEPARVIPVHHPPLPTPDDKLKTASFSQTGKASYYARKFHGRRTASGERYNMRELTAAHPRLPFGTRVKVTNLSNNRSVVVRVNDRGPHTKNRIIDLSLCAAEKIGMIGAGTATVVVESME
ncbi:MAG: septal ring lytic transglycosylase RlpA family protein [Chitinispirillaceae bacterium]|nr:septal ring lytic transglycosylase RlpA family protein [Chitinispirillaceae bacterium]